MSGFGLGTTLCKGIIKALGGNIRCKSKLMKGTEFIFLIPVENVL